MKLNECDGFGVVLAHLLDEDAQFARIKDVWDVLEALEAK
jgi:hypothetical protein